MNIYLGKDIQNELILLLSNTIKENILESARLAKYFSIIIDCTPDVSHVEQMSMIIRFVDRASGTDDCEPVHIREHFLGFLPLKETSGAGMTDIILNQLQEMSLPIEHLRGQGYDNGSNMKGDIYDALIEISEDTTLTGVSGNTARVEAQGLAKGIFNFKFVVSIVLWYNMLTEVNMSSKMLQSKEFNIHTAITQLKVTKKFLEDCRSDKGFSKTLVDARTVAEDLAIPALFEPEPVRISQKKKQFNYEADDEPILSPEEKFKINFYFAVLDRAIQSVEERFTQMNEISSVFGFLYDVHSLQNRTSKVILEDCCKLEQALQHGDSKDIDCIDLCSELQAVTTVHRDVARQFELQEETFTNVQVPAMAGEGPSQPKVPSTGTSLPTQTMPGLPEESTRFASITNFARQMEGRQETCRRNIEDRLQMIGDSVDRLTSVVELVALYK
ncbi:uncharacterized protein LOC142143080 [Mixophyes fleayi]|uniref:uncharacterized protein LOC142143080 n=1 Tax=Mixophyes fleayi TaxID=3061075 RepID=UPI003F4E3322